MARYFRPLVPLCRLCSLPAAAPERLSPQQRLAELDLTQFRPLPPVRASPAEFLLHSITLRRLVSQGVSPKTLTKYPDVMEALVLSEPSAPCSVVDYLQQVLGLSREDTNSAIGRNPRLLLDAEEGRVRAMVRYLTTHGFDVAAIRRIATLFSQVLLWEPTSVDSRLGNLQKIFFLTGEEVRSMVVAQPRVLHLTIQDVRRFEATTHRALMLSRREIHGLVTTAPQLLIKDINKVISNFIVLNHKHGLSPAVILADPAGLDMNARVRDERLAFMKWSGRAQFDPTLPLYTPISLLAAPTDEEFLNALPGPPVSMEMYDAFLRTC